MFADGVENKEPLVIIGENLTVKKNTEMSSNLRSWIWMSVKMSFEPIPNFSAIVASRS